MWRKVKDSIIVIYMTIGLFSILLNIKSSSTYMRPKRQMWAVEHPAIVLYRQHPNAMRNFYWYNTRTPIMVGKMRLKNYLSNMHMLPRYVHSPSPAQYHESYANSKRSVLRDMSIVHGFRASSTPSTTTTINYIAPPINTIAYSSGPVNPPVDFNMAPVNSFVPLTAGTRTASNAESLIGVSNQWNYSDYSNESWKKCPDRNRIINIAGRSSDKCLKKSFQDRNPNDLYSSHSTTNYELPLATTTTMPYFNYVAHTYFTLDDVILPHSAPKFTKSQTKDQQFRPSHQVFTTEIPPEIVTELFQRTTQSIPSSIATTEYSMPSKTTFFDMEYSTTPSWVSSSTSTTTTRTTTTTSPPGWTTLQPVQNNFTANIKNESYKHRLKSMKATKNFSSNIETKLKLLKLHLKNLVTTKETPIQNVTKSVVFEGNSTLIDSTTAPTPTTRRLNVNRKLRKLRVLASTKKVPLQTSRNSTDSNKIKGEYKKSKRIYQRRKHLNYTVGPEPTTNMKVDNDSINKFKRRETPSTRKSPNVDENVITRNSTKLIRPSPTLAKSRSDRLVEDKSALVTESAIMTISSGSLKIRQPITKGKSKQHSPRKVNHFENDNFIPSLPIEVYFKKVNQQ